MALRMSPRFGLLLQSMIRRRSSRLECQVASKSQRSVTTGESRSCDGCYVRRVFDSEIGPPFRGPECATSNPNQKFTEFGYGLASNPRLAILLVAPTGLISVCSKNLVARVDHSVAHSPISKTRVGLIILPIVGNAADLIYGLTFASRRQIDLAFAVAIGSAI